MNERKILWNQFYSEVIGTILTSNTNICIKKLLQVSKKKFETENIESLQQYISSINSKILH